MWGGDPGFLNIPEIDRQLGSGKRVFIAGQVSHRCSHDLSTGFADDAYPDWIAGNPQVEFPPPCDSGTLEAARHLREWNVWRRQDLAARIEYSERNHEYRALVM